MRQEKAVLQDQLKRANECNAQLQKSRDVWRQEFDSATERIRNLETELAEVQEQLDTTSKQVGRNCHFKLFKIACI